MLVSISDYGKHKFLFFSTIVFNVHRIRCLLVHKLYPLSDKLLGHGFTWTTFLFLIYRVYSKDTE